MDLWMSRNLIQSNQAATNKWRLELKAGLRILNVKWIFSEWILRSYENTAVRFKAYQINELYLISQQNNSTHTLNHLFWHICWWCAMTLWRSLCWYLKQASKLKHLNGRIKFKRPLLVQFFIKKKRLVMNTLKEDYTCFRYGNVGIAKQKQLGGRKNQKPPARVRGSMPTAHLINAACAFTDYSPQCCSLGVCLLKLVNSKDKVRLDKVGRKCT